jgi:hypothetical protein
MCFGKKYENMKSSRSHRFLLPCAVLLLLLSMGNGAPKSAASDKTPRVALLTAPPTKLRFEPDWREKGDCGPVALFVLMRLSDISISLSDVKRVVPFDSQVGCSLAEIARGADALGFPCELRFVAPDDVPKLPCPFILHTAASLERQTGHFLVVTDYSPKTREYSIIDTTFEALDNLPERRALQGYTGYVMLPNRGVVGWQSVAAIVLLAGGCLIGLATFLFHMVPRTGQLGHVASPSQIGVTQQPPLIGHS